MSVPAPSLPTPALVYTPRGIFNFSAAAGTTTTSDYLITAPLLPFGERLYVANATLGDTFDLYLIDKNNVLGRGGTEQNPTIVAHFARAINVIPNTLMQNDSPALPAELIVGLFLRASYTSTAVLGSATVVMNMRMYEQYADFLNDNG